MILKRRARFINKFDANEPNNRKIVERCVSMWKTNGEAATDMRPLYRVEEVSKKLHISMAQVAIAWSLSKEGVVAPIVGTTSLDNLQDIIGQWRLP